MARSKRIEIAGGVFHVTNRGVDQRAIVKDDIDRREWFRLFHRVAIRNGWRVFAHVLMTNHFHLFLKTPETNLSTGMHDVESAYATFFNKRHDRSGALFQGRFHPVLIESEGHLWSVSRYVHLNPSRAGMVARPEEYHWSTYRFFVDPSNAPKWLDWRTVLCELGGSEAAARSAYCRHVEAGIEDELCNPLAAAFRGQILGSDQFIGDHRQLLEETEAVLRQTARPMTIEDVLLLVSQTFGVRVELIQQRGRHENWARAAAIWLCRQDARIPLSQIAGVFGGVSTSTVTDTVRRCEDRQERAPEYRRLCEMIRGRGRDFSILAE